MKKYLLSIIALCCTIAVCAQGTEEISAILQHGEEVSVYKGSTGLQQAYAAASDGDVITLSKGTFNAVNIEKPLTIYGAGFEENEETKTAITTISGNTNVGKADAVIDGLHIEGVKINGNLACTQILKNYTIRRCYITGNMTFAKDIENVRVKQCRVGGDLSGSKTVLANGLLITNCYVWGLINYFSNESIVNIDHSFIGYQYNTYYDYNDYNNYAQFLWTNSIIFNRGPNYRMATGNCATVKNCIVVNGGGGIRDNNIIENCYYVDLANLFADGTDAAYAEDRTWKLQDETTYKGTDGTPIGPSGGFGWYKEPSTPYVKDLNATVNGTNLGVAYEAGVR
jgi:hypothetical protein